MAPYAEQIENLLTPLVGEFVSKMAVKSQVQLIGHHAAADRPTASCSPVPEDRASTGRLCR